MRIELTEEQVLLIIEILYEESTIESYNLIDYIRTKYKE
jgi:hypothetical protein